MRVHGAVLLGTGQLLQDARQDARRPSTQDCRWCYSRSRSLLQELLPAIDIYDPVRSQLLPKLPVKIKQMGRDQPLKNGPAAFENTLPAESGWLSDD